MEPTPPKIKTTNKVFAKADLAEILCVTDRTLSHLLNVIYFFELEKLDYKKDQKNLLPQQANFLFRKFDITEDEK